MNEKGEGEDLDEGVDVGEREVRDLEAAAR